MPMQEPLSTGQGDAMHRYMSMHGKVTAVDYSLKVQGISLWYLMMDSTYPQNFTHARVLKIALPIVLSNATIPFLGAVDTAVVGQLGEAAPIGAVGIGAILFSTIYGLFAFLRMGISGLASQARGQKDILEVKALLVRSILFGMSAGVVLIALQWPIFQGAIFLSPASIEVETLARQYVDIRIYSAPAAIAIYGISGWLIATERTRAILVLQISMNGLNIVLDLVFVIGFGLGVPGVAIATLISEWAALGLGLFLCLHNFHLLKWFDFALIFDRAKLKRIVIVNFDIMVRTVLLHLSMLAFLYIAADLGDVILAANQILLQFLYIAIFAIDGFAFAAEALVGLSYGAKEQAALRKALMLTSFWGMMMAVFSTLGVLVIGGWIIDLMAKSNEVREAARVYLIWVALTPLIGTPSWMLDGVFIGATRTRDMRTGMIISAILFVIVLSVSVPYWGNHGIWFALQIMLISRAITLGLRYPAIEQSIIKY